MTERFEKTLIGHCAATLAGHKCGSLFSYHLVAGETMEENVNPVNVHLSDKGARVRLLRGCARGGLLYVYRPRKLARRLEDPAVRDFLSAQGYTDFSGEGCLATLTRRLAQCEDFPHEIGVFLDYPLEDVIGFIHNRGSGFCCLGCWKAYSNAEAAEKTFALYRKCREVYLNCYGKGFDVARLTVAA